MSSSSSLKAYLAEKYMTGPKADAILARASGSKKKKRKADASAAAGTTASIVKDDDAGFGDAGGPRDDDELEEAVVEKSDRSFKKRRLDNWTTVAAPEAELPDEQPLVVDEDAHRPRGGLVTAAQFRATQPKAPEATRATDDERQRQAEDTVYRDASGKKIDTKAARAAAQRAKREQEELEARKMEWGKGLVQREEKERIRQEMERDKHRGHARYADDDELNATQKDSMRWNDPAAEFLTTKGPKGPRKPEYAGPPPPPNRFGIKPGYRWDGVDRSNGFEKKFFQRQNEKRRVKDEAYSWSVDDM